MNMTQIRCKTRKSLRTVLAAAALSLCPVAFAQPLPFTGVNMAGGDFGGPKPGVPLKYGTNFTYPTPDEFDYYIRKGVNVIRLPFHWEVIQPEANKPFNQTEMDRLKDVVNVATKKGLVVILDPHNYAHFYDKVVGSSDVPAAAFADFWSKLSAPFRGNPRVWFGLVNEPHDLPANQWLGDANAAIAAIRRTGAKNLILVPGNNWTGAHSWLEGGNDANGTVMLKIKDPAHHYIFDVHQYLDADSSGSHKEIVSPTIGSERLSAFTLWCRRNHQRGFLGEFGADSSPAARDAVDNMLTSMEKNPDVWVGYTWWAGGPWWGDYMFSIEPKNGQDSPQLSYLLPHLHRAQAVKQTRKARS